MKRVLWTCTHIVKDSSEGKGYIVTSEYRGSIELNMGSIDRSPLCAVA